MAAAWLRLTWLFLCGVLALAVLAARAPGAAGEGFEFERAFGPDGSSLSGFARACSVAVDHGDGVVYALDCEAGALFKFDMEGNPIAFGGSSPDVSGNELSGLDLGGAGTVGFRQVAVDSESHRIYLTGGYGVTGAEALQAFESDGEEAEFTAGPGAGTNEIGGAVDLHGVAVDDGGNIYAADFGTLGDGSISVYGPSGAVIVPSIAIPQPGNLAVDGNGVVYALRNSFRVGRYIPSEYPVTPSTTYTSPGADFAPNPSLSVAVEPGTNRVHVVEIDLGATGTDRVAVFGPDGTPEGTYGGPGEEGELGRPEGIAVGLEGGEKKAFVAHRPEGGLSQVEIFVEPLCAECPPEVEEVVASAVSGDSATLRARINPQGSETTYWFEYGPKACTVAACAKVPAAGASAGSGIEAVLVTGSVTGLEPQSVYHFRAVAENAFGTIASADGTFTTQGPGLGFALGDSRAWEMVSPSRKHGGTLFSSDLTAIQAAAGGEGLAYASRGPIVASPAGSTLPRPATVLAERDDDGVWSSRDLTPPHTTATKLLPDTEFNVFSPNLLRAELEPSDPAPLAPEASETTPYLWGEGSPPAFTPLVFPGNVPPGTQFGGGLAIEAASTELVHMALRSDAPLIAGVVEDAAYLWVGGELQTVSELPEGGGTVKAMLGSGRGSVRHAVAEDGSRVFWAPAGSYDVSGIALPALYLRDTVAGESWRLDVPEPGASGTGAERPAFNAASADGGVVFFTDSQRLTANASPAGRDLYRCEIGPVEGGLGCAELSNVSAPLAGSGESAEVLDQAPAASEDGSRIYFVARGVLDEVPNEEGQSARAGLPNLYLWEEGQGVRLVAPLAEEDHLVWGGMLGVPNKLGFAVRIAAAASPDGRYLAFPSQERLTGNENRNATGEPSTEAFLFDAEAEAEALSCISCNPTGAAPEGELLPQRVELFPPDPGGLWAGRQVAATLPQATHTEPEGRSLYRPRSVLSNGRTYFNSVEPLVPADSNGEWDVYQYEPVGIGSCAAETSEAAIVRSGPGCVGLVSSGTAAGDAGFLDASQSGGDVFFLTKGRLSVLDTDDELDAYDARVHGIPAVLSPPRECVGEACQPSAPPPVDPTPASESFHGSESTPRACPKGKRKARRAGKTVCVRRKHRRHAKHKSRAAKPKQQSAGKKGRAQR